MRLAHPLLLAALALVPLMIAFYFYRERRRGALVFSDISVFKNIRPSRAVKFRHVTLVLRVLAVTALVIAFARPQSTSKTEKLFTEGIDIVLTLDASKSMKNPDFKPLDRFQAAKYVIA